MRVLFIAAPVSAALALAAAPIPAQDLSPVLDLPTLAQGQVVSSTAKNQARGWYRSRSRGPTVSQVQACAQRPRFRREYGVGNAKVQKLERLCRGVGL